MKRLLIQPLQAPAVGSVTIPGSKSYTNRALLLAALTPGPVALTNPLLSDDTESMTNCLRTLGIKLRSRSGLIEVSNDVSDIQDGDYELDAGLSGTTIRFMLALATVLPGRQTLRGQAGLHKRPIGPLVEALRVAGADIEYLGKSGFPPLLVNSSELPSKMLTIGGGESSQYLSALLMVAPLIGETTISVTGKLISQPYVAMTIDTMKQFGVKVDHKANRYHIAGGQSYKASNYVVEGDVSSASYLAALATLTSSTITLKNINPQSRQADMSFFKILELMGSIITSGTDEITITGHGVQPLDVDMRDCPDQAQTLAVLAAFADGVTTISGVKSLRVKETERVKALEAELQKMGIETSSTDDSLTIHGGQPQAASIATYGDHRMAMSFAIAGARLPGMVLRDPGVVSKTFPDFWKQLSLIGIKTKLIKPNIVLIGMRGSGKTTVATALASKMGRQPLDLDELMVKKLGLGTAEIVDQHGWDYFRDQESALAQELAQHQKKIISTGGGIVLRPENITALRRQGVLILLRTSTDTLVDRLRGSHDRPPLTDAETLDAEVRQVLKQRQGLYESAADIIIDTDTAGPTEVAEQIIEQLGKEDTI